MKVCVFQWPNGAWPFNRWLLAQRPRARTILVVVPFTRCRGLTIDKDQPVRFTPHPRQALGLPLAARRRHVPAILFRGR